MHKQFHEALLARRVNLDEETILSIAGEVGLDIDRVKADMNSSAVEAELKRTKEIALSLRLSGTPAFIVGTELVSGAVDLDTLKEMIEDVRHSGK
jgi:predicted DsbA family dithiol-disulfide isomerase